MKKIGKIQINTEKVMNNDELLQLRGGYDGTCTCECYNWDHQFVQEINWATALECNAVCLMAIGHGYGYYHC